MTCYNINHNIDVEKSKPKSAICTFTCVKLKNGYQDCEITSIDEYYIQCVDADTPNWIYVVLSQITTSKIDSLSGQNLYKNKHFRSF